MKRKVIVLLMTFLFCGILTSPLLALAPKSQVGQQERNPQELVLTYDLHAEAMMDTSLSMKERKSHARRYVQVAHRLNNPARSPDTGELLPITEGEVALAWELVHWDRHQWERRERQSVGKNFLDLLTLNATYRLRHSQLRREMINAIIKTFSHEELFRFYKALSEDDDSIAAIADISTLSGTTGMIPEGRIKDIEKFLEELLKKSPRLQEELQVGSLFHSL